MARARPAEVGGARSGGGLATLLDDGGPLSRPGLERRRAGPHDEAWFWATHQGAEIDLILRRGEQMLGVEVKRADAPRLTPSIRIALEDLGLVSVCVVYPGAKRYRIAERVEAVPLGTLAKPGRLFPEGAG